MSEVLAGDEPAPWRLLRDGQIVALTRRGAAIVIDVEHPRLRRRFGGSGDGFKLTLTGCTELVFQPLDEPPIEDPGGIVGSAPDLLDAVVEPGVGALAPGMRVACASGELRLRYASLTIALDDDTPVTLAELEVQAAADAASWVRPSDAC